MAHRASKGVKNKIIFALLAALLLLNAFIFSSNTSYSYRVFDQAWHFTAKSVYIIDLLPMVLFHGSYEDVIRVNIISVDKSNSTVQNGPSTTNNNITQISNSV